MNRLSPSFRTEHFDDDVPLMVFDGQCGFCRRWIEYWKQLTGDEVRYAPYQEVAERFPEIPVDSFKQSVKLIEPDGSVYEAAHAVFRSLKNVRGKRRLITLYRRVPGFAAVSEWAYRFVARHRPAFDRLTIILWGRELYPPTYFITRLVFLRALGLIYFIAFLSLWVQAEGLIGSNGILPLAPFLDAVTGRFGGLQAFAAVPSVFWLYSGDLMLHLMCGLGVMLSIVLIIGFAPALCLLLLWILYLSLSSVSRDFLSFQWDTLLLEAGFLAIFFAPWQLSRSIKAAAPPSPAFLLLLRWLLFRLLFLSGSVKLISGDPVWRDLTALAWHYETQPLPTWVGWYAYQLPLSVHQLCCFVMFVIELLIPFLIFSPKRLRYVAAWILIVFQLLIAITGNYGFFNWIAIALCLLLFDDRFWPRRRREKLPPLSFKAASTFRAFSRRTVNAVVAMLILVISIPMTLHVATQLALSTGWDYDWVRAAQRSNFKIVKRTAGLDGSFHIVNNYGLFADMTTTRPEIVIEGSNDGREWKAYAFKWKPGEIEERPQFVAPHQPRLDWQMWFAALRRVEQVPWFQNFCVRLLQGEPDVLALLEENPFPDRPPTYIRAVLYHYRFTRFNEEEAASGWWKRQRKGLYLQPIRLRSVEKRKEIDPELL